MIEGSPDSATAAAAYERLDNRRRPPAITTAAVGLALAAASVIWYPQLVMYLVGVGLAGLGMLLVVGVFLTDRRRLLGFGVVVALVGGAVVVPWWLAERERTGSPHWTLPISAVTRDVVVDGDRLLAADDSGVFAVDLADGEVQWAHTDLGQVVSFQVATDGHVLTRGFDDDGSRFAWIDPEGRVLWQHLEADPGLLQGVNLDLPQAAADGVLVAPRCDPKAEDDSCTYIGIGADGKPTWAVDGYQGAVTSIPVPALSGSTEPSFFLPEVAVVDTGAGAGGPALMVDAASGETVQELEIETVPEDDGDTVVAASGDVVVHGTGEGAEAGTCALHGTSADGTVDWDADVPCPDGALVMGTWLYAGSPEEVDGVGPSFALDMTTGAWLDVGGLRWFNANVDDRTGEPGPGLVVQRLNQRLTGVDPATGDELWQLTTPGDAIPGVDIGRNAVSVLTRPGRGHNPFFAGEAREGADAVLAVDAVTGQVTGRLTTEETLWTSAPAGPGQVIVVVPGEMSLIGSAPD